MWQINYRMCNVISIYYHNIILRKEPCCFNWWFDFQKFENKVTQIELQVTHLISSWMIYRLLATSLPSLLGKAISFFWVLQKGDRNHVTKGILICTNEELTSRIRINRSRSSASTRTRLYLKKITSKSITHIPISSTIVALLLQVQQT